MNVFSIDIILQLICFRCSLQDGMKASHLKRTKSKHQFNLCYVTDLLLHYIMLEHATTADNKLTVKPTHFNSGNLVSQLSFVAVEHLLSYYEISCRMFSSKHELVTTDIEALHAYKLGFYERCLDLSQHNVHLHFIQDFGKSCAIVLNSFMTQLLGDELAFFSGFLSAINVQTGFYIYTFRYILISHLKLSVWLTVQCKLKLKYPIKALVKALNVVYKLSHTRSNYSYSHDFLLLAYTYRRLLTKLRSMCV